MTIAATPTQPPGPARPGPAAAEPSAGDASDRFGFWDFVDIVNPLQHIPVVNALYRAVTGDTIKPAARIIGGTVFGGPLGLAVAAADAVIEQSTGRTVGGHVAEAIGLIGDDSPAGSSSLPADRQAMTTAGTPAGPVPPLTLSLDPIPPEASAVPATVTAQAAAGGFRFYDLPDRRGPTGVPLDRSAVADAPPVPGPLPVVPSPQAGAPAEPVLLAGPDTEPEPQLGLAAAADPRRAARIDAALQSLAGDAAGTGGHPMLADRLNVSQAMLAALDRYGRAQTLAE